MSIDKLQEKIRKCKNPSMVEINADVSLIPKCILEEENGMIPAFARYSGELLDTLKELVPAVRFSFSSYALLGGDGLDVLSQLMHKAKTLCYFVLLDAPVSYTEADAKRVCDVLCEETCPWPCDGVLVCAYIGADAIKPYADKLCDVGKDVFVILRTGNKTAAQLQDLLTGSRLVFVAAADIVSRLGQPYLGRKHFSSICGVGAASAADSLRTLRQKYKNMFVLAEGYDYSNANAKNCSYAFDQMGHGAIVCAGESITGAWREFAREGYLQAAVEAAERMKKNLLRYINIL